VELESRILVRTGYPAGSLTGQSLAGYFASDQHESNRKKP